MLVLRPGASLVSTLVACDKQTTQGNAGMLVLRPTPLPLSLLLLLLLLPLLMFPTSGDNTEMNVPQRKVTPNARSSTRFHDPTRFRSQRSIVFVVRLVDVPYI
jgi:hypothetical protein